MLFNRKPPATEKKITLPQVSWEKLESLLLELGNTRSAHITYDRGQLEMIEPHPAHDRVQRLIESLLLVLADETGDELRNLGAMLLKQPELGIAIQPDACYYLEQQVRPGDRAELDLRQVPTPDLVIDVQFEPGEPKRLAMFAAIGIPEVWQYTTQMDEAEVLKGQLVMLQLQGDRYHPVANSVLYDFLPGQQVTEFIAQSDTMGLAQALTLLRSWAKSVA
jgi:Uma2 family endonuclease